MRGYAAIGLHNPKCGANVGGALRAAHVYGAELVILGGRRSGKLIAHQTNVLKAHRSMPVVVVEDVLSMTPYDCVPVAVDLVPDATPLPRYTHPDRAFYIFGPEDGTLGEWIYGRCRDRVMVPMHIGCMNLAATVNVVLYDRLAKQARLKEVA